MIDMWREIETALDEVLEMEPELRTALIRQRFADRPDLEREALSLLDAVNDSTAFLAPDASTSADVMAEGARFGAWRVLGRLGVGGMGEVWRVERADGAYRHQAALKLMRPLPPSYWPRFRNERQMLADLEHPGIARLLDGGMAPDERPFMVLEYVDGDRIDRWCEDRGLDARARVRLLLEGCEAVAFAHGKLIVHRDIKPSNILVDEGGRTRLIDFGVARFTSADDKATETPVSIDYAAPELLDGRTATTATDVYGLAATLFELLAGRPPLELSGQPLAVSARRAVEEDAPRLGDLSDRIAMPPALASDLEAVLARALRKEPSARYATVEAFADDLRRALDGRAVKAREGERGYAVRRFIRRRRWPLAAAAAIVVSLTGGLVLTLWQADEARAQRDAALSEQARLEAVQQYLYFMLRAAAENGGPDADAGRILEAAAEQVTAQFDQDPARGGPIMHTLGELFFYLNDYEAAEPLLRRLAETEGAPPDLAAAAAYDLAQVRLRQSVLDEAEALLRQAQDFWRSDRVRWRSKLVDSRLVEARLLRDRGQADDAAALLRANLPERIAISGAQHRETGVYHNDIGVMLMAAGDPDGAVSAFEAADAVWRAVGLDSGPDALNTLNNLAALNVLAGRPSEAEPLFRRAVSVRRSLYGPSAATAALLSNHGKTLMLMGKVEEAEPLLSEATAMARLHAGVGSLHYASAAAGLSEAMLALGDGEGASRLAQTALAEVESALGAAHPASAVVRIALGRTRAATGRKGEAARLLSEAEGVMVRLGSGGQSQMDAIARIRTQYGIEAPG